MQMITDMRAFIGGVVKGGKIVLVLLKIIIIIMTRMLRLLCFVFFILRWGNMGEAVVRHEPGKYSKARYQDIGYYRNIL